MEEDSITCDHCGTDVDGSVVEEIMIRTESRNILLKVCPECGMKFNDSVLATILHGTW